MSRSALGLARVDRAELRRSIEEKYVEVATEPGLGFHFHTGRADLRTLVLVPFPATRIDLVAFRTRSKADVPRSVFG